MSFCFYLYLMLYACTVKLDVIENLENFLIFFGWTKQAPSDSLLKK